MAVLHVSTTGSDSNLGASGSPVKSLSRASQLAKPGDTVLVDGGVYNGPVTINKNGTASAPVTFKPQEGEKVIIDGTGTATNTNLVTISGDHVIFQGFEVSNATRVGIGLWNTHHTQLLNNNVHDSWGTGISVGGSAPANTFNNVVQGNEVWHSVRANSANPGSVGWGQGITLKSDYSIASNNSVHDNWGEGMGVWQAKGGKVLDNRVYDNYSVNIYLDNAQGAVAQHNTVYHTYDTAFYRGGQPSKSIVIANEVVSRPLPSQDIVVTKNDIGGGRGGGAISYWAQPGATYTSMGNVDLSPNTIYATPDPFIDASSPNGSWSWDLQV